MEEQHGTMAAAYNTLLGFYACKQTMEFAFLAEVGKRLRERRQDAGMTQERLARLVGLHRTSMANIEGGKYDMPLTTLLAVCAALGCEPADVIPRFGAQKGEE
jgi:DNA-binding XRE family transcriptional regulator